MAEPTTTCEPLQPLLAAYADGTTSDTDRRRVDSHLAICPACARAVEIQRLIHDALARHGRGAADVAPPGLRTRITAALASERAPAFEVGWGTRWSAFAAAALVVLASGAVALSLVTGRSTVVLAAQLALDHLKCFVIDGDPHGEAIPAGAAEAELKREYGFDVSVPATGGDPPGRLVAVRRCLYGDGRAAHLLYRVDGDPVSLFILPGLERPADRLSLLGHDEVVWSAGGQTYLLVAAAGHADRLAQMAARLRNGAK